MGDYMVEALGDKNAALMASHGAVTVGPSMEIAFANAHFLENVAQKCVFATLLDKLYPLNPDELLAHHFMEGTSNG